MSSIARSVKLKMTLCLIKEYHPYGKANGWGHSVFINIISCFSGVLCDIKHLQHVGMTKLINSCLLGNFSCFFFCHLLIFFKIILFFLFKKLSQEYHQTVWIQIKPDPVQTVYKGADNTGRHRVNP